MKDPDPQYGVYDTQRDRLLELGDVYDLSYMGGDGPLLAREPGKLPTDELEESLDREPGRYRQVRLRIALLEDLGPVPGLE